MDKVSDGSVTTFTFAAFRTLLLTLFSLYGAPGRACLAGKGTCPDIPVAFLTDPLTNIVQYSVDDTGRRSLISDFDLADDRLSLSPVGLIQFQDAL